jgi:hypothetical protein
MLELQSTKRELVMDLELVLVVIMALVLLVQLIPKVAENVLGHLLLHQRYLHNERVIN